MAKAMTVSSQMNGWMLTRMGRGADAAADRQHTLDRRQYGEDQQDREHQRALHAAGGNVGQRMREGRQIGEPVNELETCHRHDGDATPKTRFRFRWFARRLLRVRSLPMGGHTGARPFAHGLAS